eukprot:TRINITY_DN18329_c0_g1_i1.p1 TRINITY_DN18329_c0_g1~~TRINITY_DN18329_c0_g1_i1.p1  ORF type:complete len:239 (-),score=35.54 TRINITY_DN18329_c0_g1_i1:88-804(-)
MGHKWILLFILLSWHLWPNEAVCTSRALAKRELLTINMNKMFNFLAPKSTVKFLAVTGSIQFIVGVGWFLSGILWYALSVSLGEDSSLRGMLDMTSDILSPTSAAINVLRCLTAFIFLALGFLTKTILTIGLVDTMGLFKEDPITEMVASLLSSRKFVLAAIGRALLGSVFQLIVFSALYLFVAKSPNRIKRRRKRRWVPHGENDIQLKYIKVLEGLQGAQLYPRWNDKTIHFYAEKL